MHDLSLYGSFWFVVDHGLDKTVVVIDQSASFISSRYILKPVSPVSLDGPSCCCWRVDGIVLLTDRDSKSWYEQTTIQNSHMASRKSTQTQNYSLRTALDNEQWRGLSWPSCKFNSMVCNQVVQLVHIPKCTWPINLNDRRQTTYIHIYMCIVSMAQWQNDVVCNREATYVTPRFCVCMTHRKMAGGNVSAIDRLLTGWMLD